jgi:hypothetical protein
MKIGAEGLRDIPAEEGTDALSRDATHELADQETEGNRVVPMAVSRASTTVPAPRAHHTMRFQS